MRGQTHFLSEKHKFSTTECIFGKRTILGMHPMIYYMLPRLCSWLHSWAGGLAAWQADGLVGEQVGLPAWLAGAVWWLV